ncbi:hypothetical protein [Stenotrophomonas mori]|uniref:Uncharacterized protein n=1 Tax=Stenotrophomonas mori TaxID=2871096 RepID=A0ABT0SGJ9_9GAMM|nr:hypothetical protein [Stenotrophomonas mori]MCL7714443.1 hypothetical protein [Stenotrophomonas mori]
MSIEDQVKILERLVEIMKASAAGSYERLECEFGYETYENGWSVGSKYSQVKNGQVMSELLDDPGDEASDLVHELHRLMKSHAGGAWDGFLLSVDFSGKADAKFIY